MRVPIECILIAARPRPGVLLRIGVCCASTLLVLGGLQNATAAQQRDAVRSGESQTITVPMAAERWSDTSSPLPAPQKKAVRFVGRLPGYREGKHLANLRVQANSQTHSGGIQVPLAGVQASASGITVFDGPNESNTPYIPPDDVIAAGPQDILVAINSLLAIYDKSGKQLGGFQDFHTFFSSLGTKGEIFDPRLIYDQTDGRYILSAAQVDTTSFTAGNVLIAVSQTSDPTGVWYKFAVSFLGRNATNTVNTFPDFPGLGLSNNALYITSNQFALNAQCLGTNPNSPCSFSDAWIKVIGLPGLLSGNPALNITTFKNVTDVSGNLAFGIQPALTYGALGSEFLVAASFTANPGNFLNLFSINTSGVPALSSGVLTVPPFDLPPNAVQFGSGNTIDTGDFRVLNAVWSNGSLWLGQNVASSNFSGPAGRWYEIGLAALSSASLVQSGDVTAVGAAYYPAISETPSGVVALSFTTSSSVLPASAAFTGRLPADPSGAMRSYSMTRIGLGPYDEQVERWGDYSGISQDPDGSGLWTIAEYASTPNPRFATAIAKVTAPPSLSVAPQEIDFGGVLTGKVSQPMSVVFTNVGGSSITLGALTKSGPNAAYFSVTSDPCSGSSLAAGQSCTATVTFTPSQTSVVAFAYLTMDAGSGPVAVGLTGSGYVQAVLNVSPAQINFPPTVVRTASAPATITVTNTGNAPGTISVLSLSGPFTQTNNCGSALAPNATCQFFVVFRPYADGSFQNLMDFNTPGQVASVNLLGTGIDAPAVLFCPVSLTFGNQLQGTSSPSQTVILTNIGSAALTITKISMSGDFRETDNCGGSLPARGSCNISVTFSPSGLNSRTGLLAVNDDAAGSPQSVSLTGTGVAAAAGLDSSAALSAALVTMGDPKFRPDAPAVIAAERSLDFEPNVGQFSKDVSFIAHGLGFALFFSPQGIELGVGRPASHPTNAQGPNSASFGASDIKMIFKGANPQSRPEGVQERPGKVNYIYGHDPAQWHTNVPTYARVRIPEVYDGVDLVYYGDQNHLEYDFIVAPRADPGKIQLVFDGAKDLHVTREGDLLVSTATGSLRLHKPVIYQFAHASPEEKVYRPGGWELGKRQRVKFRLGPYDRRDKLIIDPVLSFSSYLGGSQGEVGKAIAVDSAHNIYVSGGTYSPDFPVTPNAYLKTCGSQQFPCNSGGDPQEDGFVAKLSPDGSTMIYATFLGGSFRSTEIRGIAVDPAGSVYLTGPTGAPDFPTTPGAFQSQCAVEMGPNVCPSSFVAKLDPTGSSLIYSTYLGGPPSPTRPNLSGNDVANAIAIDSHLNAYIGGSAGSPDFPITTGAFVTTPATPGQAIGFVSVLNPAGSALTFSTFLGGSGNDSVNGIALDSLGNFYAAGNAGSLDFPTTPGAFQTAPYTGNIFVTKFSPTGSVLYSTLIGDNGGVMSGNAIAVDSQGAAYVTGQDRGGFPITAGAFETTVPGAFVAKLHPAGCALIYSTYLNARSTFSSASTSGQAIAVDSNGDAYVAGFGSSPVPRTPPDPFGNVNALEPFVGTSGFTFVSELDPTGSKLLFSTPLGGSSEDDANAMALDSAGNIYLTGIARSQDFPDVAAFQPICTACLPSAAFYGATAYVAKISPAQATGVFLTRPSLDFQPLRVNAMFSQTLSIGLMNDQAVPLNISNVSLTGADYNLLISQNPCIGTLAPGAGCVISVLFLPTSGGPADGMVAIQDNGPGGPRQVPLHGFALADFLVSANTQQSGPLFKGVASVGFFVNVQNALSGPPPGGDVQLACSGVTTTTCTFNPPSVPIGGQSILTLGNLSGLTGDNLSFSIVGTMGSQAASFSEQLLFQDFTFAASQAAATVKAGQSAVYGNLTVTPINGLTGSILLSCSNLPAYAACVFSPSSVTAGGASPVTSMLTVTTSLTSVASLFQDAFSRKFQFLPATGWPLALAVSVLILLTVGVSFRAARLASVVLCIAMVLLISCQGGGTSAPAPTPTPTVHTTPPGNYVITVNAVDAATMQRSVQLNLTVN
jgi:hypothetical protein